MQRGSVNDRKKYQDVKNGESGIGIGLVCDGMGGRNRLWRIECEWWDFKYGGRMRKCEGGWQENGMVMGATYEKKGCKTIVKKIWKVFKITFASVENRL